jgi:hypothetical protein
VIVSGVECVWVYGFAVFFVLMYEVMTLPPSLPPSVSVHFCNFEWLDVFDLSLLLAGHEQRGVFHLLSTHLLLPVS